MTCMRGDVPPCGTCLAGCPHAGEAPPDIESYPWSDEDIAAFGLEPEAPRVVDKAKPESRPPAK